MDFKTFDLLGVKIAVIDLRQAAMQIENWILNKKKTYICVAPVATIVDCVKNREYRAIVNNAGMVTPDGVPLVWMGRLKGYKDIGRTCGPDLMSIMCDLGQKRNFRHYFYGSDSKTLDLIIKNLTDICPGMQISGSYAPPIRPVGETESSEILDQINNSAPDILWVGLGSPKQDYWMANHRSRLNVPVIIGVGAAFDFLAGTKKRAPIWMRSFGFEWFYRLMNEPHRLWKRYLIGNTVFIFLAVKDLLGYWIKEARGGR